jgi:hypothetical protein
MKRFKCLLLDANVVIKLFSLGLWDAVVSQCEIHLSEIVVGEADYYENSEGTHHDIDLTEYIKSGQVNVFSRTAADLKRFRTSFDPEYVEKLDDGETESLVHLLSGACEGFFLCSADAIVFRVLGNVRLAENGVSLEEVLGQFRLRRDLEYQFTKDFRRRWSQTGLGDSLFGAGFRQ